MSENQPLVDHVGPNVQPDPGTALPEPKNPDVSHEHSDVNVSGLLGIAGVIVAVGILLCALVGGVFHLFQAREAKFDETVPDLMKEDAQRPLHEQLRSIRKEGQPLLEGMEKTVSEERMPALPVFAASFVGLMGSPLGQGPLLVVSARIHERTPKAPQEYEWVDRQKHIARIPVAAAMRVVLEKNLLHAEKEGKEGEERPSSSNSGRGSGEKQP
jgi:hypothetical protein